MTEELDCDHILCDQPWAILRQLGLGIYDNSVVRGFPCVNVASIKARSIDVEFASSSQLTPATVRSSVNCWSLHDRDGPG